MSKQLSLEDWKKVLTGLDIKRLENVAFIGNQFVKSARGDSYEKALPFKQSQKLKIAACTASDVDKAVASAKKSFEEATWRKLPAKERKKKLLRFASSLEAHKEEIALLETLDMGKPIRYSLEEDVPGGIDHFQWMAECVDKLYDEIAPSHQDFIGMIRREPAGVVAAITPWNYPFLMMSWKAAPALAAGNSLVLKPSEKSPLTALYCCYLWQEQDLPPGVFNVIPGFGEDAGVPLSYHKDVDVLAFTGSTATAKKLLIASGKSNMKRVWLEAGGKSPTLVLPDADLDAAAKSIASSIFYNQGAVCIAGSRLILHKKIKEKLLEKLLAETTKWFPEHPLDPKGNMGAIVDDIQYQKIQNYIRLGKEEARLLTLPKPPGFSAFAKSAEYKEGLYVPPTIFDEVKNTSVIAQEEIFGPVLAVMTANDEAEMLRLANDTPFGLAATVWSKDILKAELFARNIRAGSVWINCWGDGDATIPFGGMKQSGFGRDKSLHAFDKYTDIKAIVLGK